MSVLVKLQWAEGADRGLGLPKYETSGAAGADLCANLPDGRPIEMPSGTRKLVPTGLRMQIPDGYEVQIRPRSGLVLKHGVTMANAPGTIDSDYRGPVGVILINLGAEQFTVTHGMRVAQMVLAPVSRAEFEVAPTLEPSRRGNGGFGSTGL